MNVALFYLWTFLGSLIFCSALILLGNALGAHLDGILPLLHQVQEGCPYNHCAWLKSGEFFGWEDSRNVEPKQVNAQVL